MKNEYQVEGDVVSMEVQGKRAIFDLADLPAIERFGSWKLSRGTSISTDFRHEGKMRKITLHKLLAGSKFVKWLNGNAFDFRRQNMVPIEKSIRPRPCGSHLKGNPYRVEGDVVIIQIKGQHGESEAYVDLNDYPLVSEYTWNLNPAVGYAQAKVRLGRAKNKGVYMHRLIAGAVGFSVKVDHINGQKLDNRRSNLRVCGNSENLHNSHKHRDGIVAGVSMVVFWEARIQVNCVPYVKRFKTKEEAIAQRLKWESELNPSGLN
ncbi:MAG: HNH endonuclease [Desulfosalsimonadaceae bacterium]